MPACPDIAAVADFRGDPGSLVSGEARLTRMAVTTVGIPTSNVSHGRKR
jgi:hypothetical protein